jgi:hypothetical protein
MQFTLRLSFLGLVTKLFALATLLFILSCQSSPTTKSTDTKVTEPSVLTSPKLGDFPSSPLFDDAKLSNMRYTEGKFSFDVDSKSYELGSQTTDAGSKMCANSGKGQHIHLIINNEPYAAKYEAEFDYEVPNGDHYLLAFLSRSYHESIKQPNAKIAKKINVKDNSITATEDIDQSMVFYSRPKGTYVGKDTDKVMLDYYLLNPKQGQYVTANVNGSDMDLKKWKPYFLEGLPMGENTITLTLKNADGSKVDAPLNPVTRTFTLKADPESNM